MRAQAVPSPLRAASTSAASSMDRTRDLLLVATGRRHRRRASLQRSRPSRRSYGGAMDAWILDESPGRYRWGSIADPEVGPGDVAVAPVASALNHMDLWLTRGRPRPALPHVPGCDVAGRVAAVGSEVTGWSVGDEVVVNPAVAPIEAVVALGDDAPLGRGFQILGEQRWGGHGGLVVVPARNVVRRPAGRSWEECAAYPLATLTAWRMLRRARLAAGERCL